MSNAPQETLAPLLSRLLEAYPFSKVQQNIKGSRLDLIAPAAAHLAVAAAVSQIRQAANLNRIQLIIVTTGREAEEASETLAFLDPEAEILEFASWETLPHERLSPSAETVGKRLKVLHRLHELKNEGLEHNVYVLASIRAALQPVIFGLDQHPPLMLRKGADYLLPELALKLVEIAYHRVDMVTRRGEFAMRGGLVDIFPTTSEHALRLEFFGDELEDIRQFSVSDQRTISSESPLGEVTLYPAREIIITPAVANRARQMQHEFPNLKEILEKVSQGIPADGMESLAPVLVDKLVSFSEYLPKGSAVTLLSPEKSAARAQNLKETNQEFLNAAWNAAIEGAQAPIDLAQAGFYDLSEFTKTLGAHQVITVSQFFSDDSKLIDLQLHEIPNFKVKEITPTEFIADQLLQKQHIYITAEGHGTAERIREQLISQKIDQVECIQAPLKHGFTSPDANLIVMTENEFYQKNSSYVTPTQKKLAKRRGATVDPLTLKAGDYVVHEVHGIGRFKEMVQRQTTIGKQQNTREFLVIEYAPSKRNQPNDTLFIPTDQLDLLTKYVGSEAPVLSRMGGTDWAATKGRARKAVRKIAIDLVKLYSVRVKARGHAFSPDTAWQRELEDAFSFVETQDQLTTIEEVKRDMQSPVPMDRLLAGDVGYGKTEVAVRAAFKAIQDGKQVAMLVPTTLLVRQHVETFHERYSGFPVKVAALSRFQSPKESKAVIEQLETGAIDMVIGTHRLLSQGVKFKDLGLIIIDEEQRFGVEHKEKLKDLKHNVDVLSMSATPIPRTLELAITGIREMSTLATPPEDRHPILTYVGGYSESQVAAAIRRELLREGQVFFIHNRVQSIDKTAADLRELVPEARIAVAHGQMGEHDLEQVVIDFWERKFDVLVSTTIIETGIDIPNANTLIVDRAENFGLSQLHQIRGRVGRSRERAYAYFFYDPSKPLTDTAHDRLATIATNNELGSGMQVAMKDLEIRGAGNLLGGEQSGHIAGVGFDLYLRMIGEAVADFKGEKIESPAELRLELPIDAHIPHTYVDSDRLRLEAYHKLSAASGSKASKKDLQLILEELVDRYGEAPQQVINLVNVTELRQQANRLEIKELIALGPTIKLSPIDLTPENQVKLNHLFPGTKYLHQSKLLIIPSPQLKDQEMIDYIWALLARVFSAGDNIQV